MFGDGGAHQGGVTQGGPGSPGGLLMGYVGTVPGLLQARLIAVRAAEGGDVGDAKETAISLLCWGPGKSF